MFMPHLVMQLAKASRYFAVDRQSPSQHPQVWTSSIHHTNSGSDDPEVQRYTAYVDSGLSAITAIATGGPANQRAS